MTKKKLAAEKADLEKQISAADNTIRSLGKLRTSLSTQVSLSRNIFYINELSWKALRRCQLAGQCLDICIFRIIEKMSL